MSVFRSIYFNCVTIGTTYKDIVYPPDRTPYKFITSFFVVWRDQRALRSRRKTKKVRVQRKKTDQTKMREMERYTIQLLPKPGLQRGWTGEEMANSTRGM